MIGLPEHLIPGHHITHWPFLTDCSALLSACCFQSLHWASKYTVRLDIEINTRLVVRSRIRGDRTHHVKHSMVLVQFSCDTLQNGMSFVRRIITRSPAGPFEAPLLKQFLEISFWGANKSSELCFPQPSNKPGFFPVRKDPHSKTKIPPTHLAVYCPPGSLCLLVAAPRLRPGRHRAAVGQERRVWERPAPAAMAPR